MPQTGRLNKVIELLEHGKIVFGGAIVTPGNIDGAVTFSDMEYDFLIFEMEHEGFHLPSLRLPCQRWLPRRLRPHLGSGLCRQRLRPSRRWLEQRRERRLPHLPMRRRRQSYRSTPPGCLRPNWSPHSTAILLAQRLPWARPGVAPLRRCRPCRRLQSGWTSPRG